MRGWGYFGRLIKEYELQDKFLSSNITYKTETELSQNIIASKMMDFDGTKVGIIGASPFDFKKLAFINSEVDFIDIKQLDETLDIIELEADKLKKQGADIIFLLAHTGEKSPDEEDNYYDEFANIKGINVVAGGHDHRQVDRWVVNKYGEPVKIISTGQSETHNFDGNLDIVAKLKLEVENGVLERDKCEAEFVKLEGCDDAGCEEILFKLNKPLEPSKPIFGHSEIGNIVADSNLWYVNEYTKGEKADFAFVNAGTIRANFDNLNVTCDDIKSVVPFTTSTLIKTKLTKKQIVDTLNWCALSTSFGKVSPGCMQVSGMEYSINPDLSVSDIHILNSDGSIKYDLDNFDDNDEFTAVYDVFLATGVAGLKDLKKDWEENEEIKKEIEFFNTSRQEALSEYLSKNSDLGNYQKQRIRHTPKSD